MSEDKQSETKGFSLNVVTSPVGNDELNPVGNSRQARGKGETYMYMNGGTKRIGAQITN